MKEGRERKPNKNKGKWEDKREMGVEMRNGETENKGRKEERERKQENN